MSLSSFSFPSLKTLKKSKSTNIHNHIENDIEISDIRQIGNYQLGKEIGSGAFGKVLLGKHIPTGEKVAIKILNKIILSRTPDDYQLVKQELSILKIVKHKYIVRLFEILETSRYIFIVMEYCEGGDIMNYIISRGRLSENESLKFFHQLINALFYLHSQNIAHRDIKIDNLLLDSNNNLKLIDFGLSTKYKDNELLNQPCGTIVYAAPEVLDYKDYHGMLADVWSCGIVLYGMLSGFLPFGDSDDEINKKMVLEGKIKMPNFFSEGAKNLLKHMLEVNPLTRFTLDDIMEHSWFNKIKYNITPGIIAGVNKIPVDEKIVDLCVTYNLDKNKVRNSIINNKFNNESAMYYLLVQKLKNIGQDSVSDLCSKDYINYMLNESNDILSNDKDNKKKKNDDINNNEQKKNQITKDKNKSKILSEFKKYYNVFNTDNNIDKYIDFETSLESKNDNKKYINIENNFKNNIIIFDDRNKINEINKYAPNRNIATHKINFPKINLKKNLLDSNEDDDFILREFMNRNSLETDRIITKGKLINNQIYGNVNKIKKNLFEIRNKNFPLDKYLDNNKYFNSLDNKNTKNNKKIFKIKKLKNNKKFFYQKALENSNISYGLNNNKLKISLDSKNYLNTLKSKLNKIGKQNLTEGKNIENNNNLLPKENINSYLEKSKIINQVINIPHLNINQINYNKDSTTKIFKKRKINMNINNKPLKNKSEEKRNINIQGNKEPLSKKILINLYTKKQNASTIISNLEKNNKKDKDIESKKNLNKIENRPKISDTSLNNDKKLNKTIVLNLIDNIKKNSQFPKEKKNNIIQTKNDNKSKNDFSLNVIMHLDKKDNKNFGYKTDRESQNRIYNLKKNNHLKIKNLDIRNKIKNLNLSNNNTNRTVFFNSKNNIINNSIIRNTINIIKKNPAINEHAITLNQLNTIDSKEKCNTSRINVHIKNKKIRKRNLNTNFLNNKLDNISGSSILNNKFEQTRTIFISNKKNDKIINFYPKLRIEQIQNNNTINTNRFINTNVESTIIYKKKSPKQLSDLSDSPRKKIFNEKMKQNKIQFKPKEKPNCEKKNSKNIFDKFQKVYLNKNKNFMKKLGINSQFIKSTKNNLNQKNDKNIIKTKNHLLTENTLNNNNTNANKLYGLKFINKKYFVNINDEYLNSSVEKKSHKNIKFRNINLANKIKKNIYTQFNNQSYLTLNNNDNINYSHNFELTGKKIFNNINRDINSNAFNN